MLVVTCVINNSVKYYFNYLNIIIISAILVINNCHIHTYIVLLYSMGGGFNYLWLGIYITADAFQFTFQQNPVIR